MSRSSSSHAVVIGSGPNGLSAAIQLARAGHQVTVHEAAAHIGGGTHSAELTLPGFLHDVCSAIHPMAAASPCFEQYPLAEFGLEWIESPSVLAHPLDDGTAVTLERSLNATCNGLGQDGASWRGLMDPLAAAWPQLRDDLMGPMPRIPRHPWLMARFGMHALMPARMLARKRFRGGGARALFGGLAAHSVMGFDEPMSAAVGLILGALGHVVGWPFPRGGAQRIADALAGYLKSLGGRIVTESRITRLPEDGIVMCDVSPRQFLSLAGGRLPSGYRRALERYQYGPGVFKMDWALDAPIPWTAAACKRAATVHVGGTLEEIADWEANFQGRPFLLLAQPSLFDQTRAPSGKHTAWAYCHVPNGSTEDLSDAIEQQIERFAPGFRGRIVGRSVLTPAALEARNANLVGGDITGGAMNLRQFFLRPTRKHYRTPLNGVYLCSSSTPPGGAVHGMCGYHAAHAADRR